MEEEANELEMKDIKQEKEDNASTTTAIKEEQDTPVKKEPDEPKIEFQCSICKLINASCDYYGTKPPFNRKLQITEASYIMKDPFCPPPSAGRPNPEYFLIIGVNCAFCETPVCKSPECSFYYGKTFCCKCTLENIKQFPLEIQTKARKQLNKSSSS